jgi:hypothetical protein
MIDYTKTGQIKAMIDTSLHIVNKDPASWLEYAEWVGGPAMIYCVENAIEEGEGDVYEAASYIHLNFMYTETDVTPDAHTPTTAYFLWVLLDRLCQLNLNRADEPLPRWLKKEIKTWK